MDKIKNKSPRRFLKKFLFSAILCPAVIYAQFSGLSNFVGDTLIKGKLKRQKVQCVVEYLKEDSSFRFNSRYCFNKNGDVTDMILPRGEAYDRLVQGYNEKGQLIRGETYAHSDTVHLDNWKNWTVDDKDRVIKEERGFESEQNKRVFVSFESKFIKEGKGQSQVEVHRHDPNIPADYVIYGRDSISARDTFFVTYQYRGKTPSSFPEKKTVTCVKTVAGCVYSHELSYRLYGSRETVDEIKTTYYQYDKKNNLLEYGEIDNRENYMNYMQDYPEEYNAGYYVPLYITALLEGKTHAKKNAQLKQTFNTKGQLLTRTENEYQYTFTYSPKGLLAKQEVKGERYGHSIQTQAYNKQGFIVRAIVTYTDLKGKKSITETKYTYSYY